MVVFLSSKSLPLTIGSRDFSQAEKKITVITSWATDKIPTIFAKNDNSCIDHVIWTGYRMLKLASNFEVFVYFFVIEKHDDLLCNHPTFSRSWWCPKMHFTTTLNKHNNKNDLIFPDIPHQFQHSTHLTILSENSCHFVNFLSL